MPPKRYVICKICGSQFDVNSKGAYFDGSRYTCKSCARKARGGSWFSKNWKILIGGIFLIGGLGNITTNWEAALFGIVVGGGLLFWHFYPQIKARRGT